MATKTPSKIHFVSRFKDRGTRGHVEVGMGFFTTEAWAVSEAAAQSVQEVWLHDRKGAAAWDGGAVVERTPIRLEGKGRPNRWRFLVRRPNVLVAPQWPGDVCGGPEKAYV